MKYIKHILLILTIVTFQSCGIYSLSPPTSIKADTFQVNRFENNALLIEPGLELDFQNALQDKIVNQTNYKLDNTNADLVYEGEITTYRISPTTATSDDRAAQNRLTITVKITFVNQKEEGKNFDQSFSRFADFSSSTSLATVENDLITEIFEQITQDIYNKTLGDW